MGVMTELRPGVVINQVPAYIALGFGGVARLEQGTGFAVELAVIGLVNFVRIDILLLTLFLLPAPYPVPEECREEDKGREEPEPCPIVRNFCPFILKLVCSSDYLIQMSDCRVASPGRSAMP